MPVAPDRKSAAVSAGAVRRWGWLAVMVSFLGRFLLRVGGVALGFWQLTKFLVLGFLTTPEMTVWDLNLQIIGTLFGGTWVLAFLGAYLFDQNHRQWGVYVIVGLWLPIFLVLQTGALVVFVLVLGILVYVIALFGGRKGEQLRHRRESRMRAPPLESDT